MLVLTRKAGEQIQIGDHIVVTVVRLLGGGVRLGIEAPNDARIVRGELGSASSPANIANEANPVPAANSPQIQV